MARISANVPVPRVGPGKGEVEIRFRVVWPETREGLPIEPHTEEGLVEQWENVLYGRKDTQTVQVR